MPVRSSRVAQDYRAGESQPQAELPVYFAIIALPVMQVLAYGARLAVLA